MLPLSKGWNLHFLNDSLVNISNLAHLTIIPYSKIGLNVDKRCRNAHNLFQL